MRSYADLSPDLLVERRGAVALVTMNAPERMNAIDGRLHDALHHVWELLADDDEVGAVVLSGAGAAFSAGGSMDHIRLIHDDPAARRRTIRAAERLLRAIIGCEVPVVAAVHGLAIGLGATLAVFSDLVVMADDTFLSDPHVSVGVVAGDGGAVIWPLLIGLLRAKEHLLLGDRIDAEDCLRLGLANRVVPPAHVLATALALADQLAAQPRQALRDTKRALNLHLRVAADLVLDFSLAAEAESLAGDDVLATLERHAGGRRPVP
jgi:enoyl-CoA hydratase